MSVDCAPAIVEWGKWLLARPSQVHYTEGPARMTDVHHPGGLPMQSDCSSTDTCLFAWAGAPDPNGLNYDGYGYTGTMVKTGKIITTAQIQPGNTLAIYFDGKGFLAENSVHVALCISSGPDPMTISHGSDPMSQLRVSQDGRPVRFFRFDTMGNVAHYPPGFVVPVVQRILAGMAWTPQTTAPGDWLCFQGRKAGIPNLVELHKLQAHSIPQKTQTAVQLKAMPTVKWGSL